MVRQKHSMAGLCAAIFMSAGLAGGAAQACTPSYTVQPGDTLFSIAEANLGDMTKWSLVFYNNPDLAGGSIVDVPVGTVLAIPCAPGTVSAPDPTPLQQENAELVLVTASNYAPFTDRDWPGQGMATELVNAALENMPAPVTYSITWEDDWSKHLDPMLKTAQVDMGFPWFRPDCISTPDDFRCVNFHYSDPLVDLVILLFVRADSGLTFEDDSALHGKVLCRPARYFTHDLERPDRQWLTRGLVTLEQPPTPDDCFEMLLSGAVDAVAVNEFLGVQKMFQMGLTDQVVPLPRPLSVEGLHVVISKAHWRGTTHLFRFNAGLAKLRQSEQWGEIVQRHLALFWDQIRS